MSDRCRRAASQAAPTLLTLCSPGVEQKSIRFTPACPATESLNSDSVVGPFTSVGVDGPVECGIIASFKLSNCSATKSDRRWAGSRTECWADRRGGSGFARGHTHLDLLDEHSGRHARFSGQPDRQVSSTIQGRSSNHSAPVCESCTSCAEREHGQSNKPVEQRRSQWTAGELCGVECETQSLRH